MRICNSSSSIRDPDLQIISETRTHAHYYEFDERIFLLIVWHCTTTYYYIPYHGTVLENCHHSEIASERAGLAVSLSYLYPWHCGGVGGMFVCSFDGLMHACMRDGWMDGWMIPLEQLLYD